MRRVSRALVVVLLLLVACSGSEDGLVFTDARIGMPTGPNAALYFTVENHSDGADVLEGADTAVASAVEIHETITDDHGTTGMQPVDAPLEVTTDQSLVFEPGGLHLMLVEVDRLEVGEEVEVRLTWQVAGEMTIDALVVEPQDVADDEGHDG